ncbi:MAG: hypothetical protein J5U17_00980 [Candidatus Methanoperedens sp.]|nr:hypothetical protein [Candidatus Methanoperedens sp.]MCE8427668.1 hypothetical protein [Candidatus Methanoperedens sp.]
MEKILDREVAWRIFAYEYNRSNLYVSEGDDRAPNYIVTPTGVKCNRLFITGVVTEVENIKADNNLWRARIADPTGVFTVYAGQYQSEAAIFLSELIVPAYVAVVGKARKFEPEEGSIYTLVRPEEMNKADEKQRDRWVLDTAERSLERISLVEEALRSGASGNDLREQLVTKGATPVHADGILRAIEHYRNLESILQELKHMIIHAIKTVASDHDANITEKPLDKITEEIEPPEKVPDVTPEQGPKEAIAEIIERLDTGKGTSYASIVDAALAAGIDGASIETGIKELMSEGRCYEPKIGHLRKV